ncbi:glycosyltransferase family 4 protein [Candidatus Omnitrophota bacterium]
MKIVHLSTTDMGGGASREAHHLHLALSAQGVKSKLLVQKSISDDPTIERVFSSGKGRRLRKMAGSIDLMPLLRYSKSQKKGNWHPGWINLFPVEKLSQVQQADIIALYWVCGGFLGVKTISRLLRMKKPVVWRLSDMWPFTGGCHYAGSCRNFEKHCGKCTQLGSARSRDLSYKVFQQKKRSWNSSSLTLASPSKWLAARASQSLLFKDTRIEVIPNGVDINTYRPIPKAQARELLNLPKDKALVLFGAVNPISDPRKGYAYLESALEIVKEMMRLPLPDLVVFGSRQKPMEKKWPAEIHAMGFLHDEISKALLYAACDVFVAPSIEDNFPNTILEAMSCGTPCVAFNIGGIPDMIQHKHNGYLAKPFETGDLAYGISWMLSDSMRLRILSQEARKRVEKEFSLDLEAQHYLKLYENLLA